MIRHWQREALTLSPAASRAEAREAAWPDCHKGRPTGGRMKCIGVVDRHPRSDSRQPGELMLHRNLFPFGSRPHRGRGSCATRQCRHPVLDRPVMREMRSFRSANSCRTTAAPAERSARPPWGRCSSCLLSRDALIWVLAPAAGPGTAGGRIPLYQQRSAPHDAHSGQSDNAYAPSYKGAPHNRFPANGPAPLQLATFAAPSGSRRCWPASSLSFPTQASRVCAWSAATDRQIDAGSRSAAGT